MEASASDRSPETAVQKYSAIQERLVILQCQKMGLGILDHIFFFAELANYPAQILFVFSS